MKQAAPGKVAQRLAALEADLRVARQAFEQSLAQVTAELRTLAQTFRSPTYGWAYMQAPSGTVIAYATGPDAVANDGDGPNGLYTQELLRHIREPGFKIGRCV